MKFTGFIACGFAAWTCAEKAMGIEAQYLFASDVEGVWWAVALFWAVNAIAFLARP